MSSRAAGARRSPSLSTKICSPSFHRFVPLPGRPVCCDQPCAKNFRLVTSSSAPVAATTCLARSALETLRLGGSASVSALPVLFMHLQKPQSSIREEKFPHFVIHRSLA